MDKKRFCLIINNFTFKYENTRYGSKFDVKKMQLAFFQCGFHIKTCNDPTLRELRNNISQLSKENLNDVECIVVILMTHGASNDRAYAKDKKYNITEEIINSKIFQEFKEPKILITQCCKDEDKRVKSSSSDEEFEEPKKKDKGVKSSAKVKRVRNLFRFDSTYEGFKSARNNDGSKFIKLLFEEIKKYGFVHDIAKIAEAIIEQFKDDHKQCPTIGKVDFKGFTLGKLTN